MYIVVITCNSQRGEFLRHVIIITAEKGSESSLTTVHFKKYIAMHKVLGRML